MSDAPQPRTVILVAAADRGHYQWAGPLAERLISATVRCELWTNEHAARWAPGLSGLQVRPMLGDGRSLASFVASYKWAASAGDSDAEGQAAVVADGFAGLVAAMERFGCALDTDPMAAAASEEGRAALGARVREPDVAAVVWEYTWCRWVAGVCLEADVPSLGVRPSFVDAFRSHGHVAVTSFDGETRTRDRPEDVDGPIADLETAAGALEAGFMLAAPLRRGIALLPAWRTTRRLFGAFLPRDAGGGPGRFDTELKAWLDGAVQPPEQRPTTLISLGSQSALHSLSASAEARACASPSSPTRPPHTPGRALAAARSTCCWRASRRRRACSSPRPRISQTTGRWPPHSQTAACASPSGCRSGRLSLTTTFEPLCRTPVRPRDPWRLRPVRRCSRRDAASGANSVHEALALGVPIVPFPFFDDQHYIAVRLEELYGYAAAASAAGGCFTPVRKAALRDRRTAQIEAAVRLALAVPASLLEELRQEVVDEDGAEAAARVVRAKMRP